MNFSSLDLATEACRNAIIVAMQTALPLLVIGLIVGLLVSIVQAITQIQEQTLSAIPKIIAMATALFLLLPWILSVMTEYTRRILSNLTDVVS